MTAVKDIKSDFREKYMDKRTIPVCFTTEQYKEIAKYAKKRGMLNASQALEKILNEN